MKLKGKVAVVTGGANGIGLALCRRFAEEDARAIVVADIDFERSVAVAEEIGGTAVRTDVSNEADIVKLVNQTTNAFGHIDLLCLNAGIAIGGGVEAPDEDWYRILNVNVMAHVWGARAVLPAMLERGNGYLLHTASAAGLLTNIGAAPYSVSKHAVVALAEWLSITYGDQGIGVSCLCPMGVKTDLLALATGAAAELLGDTAIEPEVVADFVISGLEAEHFLILPHPEVREMYAKKATDYERWLRGMRRLASIHGA